MKLLAKDGCRHGMARLEQAMNQGSRFSAVSLRSTHSPTDPSSSSCSLDGHYQTLDARRRAPQGSAEPSGLDVSM
jgi:hypothetical protein